MRGRGRRRAACFEWGGWSNDTAALASRWEEPGRCCSADRARAGGLGAGAGPAAVYAFYRIQDFTKRCLALRR